MLACFDHFKFIPNSQTQHTWAIKQNANNAAVNFSTIVTEYFPTRELQLKP